MVTGGSRSGKSSFAEKYCLDRTEQPAYIATAQAFDHEMKERILRHQLRRGKNWATFEVPWDILSVAKELEQYDYVLLDCLTMLIFNKMYELNPQLENLSKAERITLEEQTVSFIEELLLQMRSIDTCFVVVTNEIGMGIVPENALSRLYRDIVGKANQLLAEASKEVYFVVSGIALLIKEKI